MIQNVINCKFVFVEMHSRLNMLCHVQKVDLCQSNEARVDVAARGFCVKGKVAYFDVKVFNSIAKVYLTQSLNTAHRTNKQTKKRAYNRRVNTIDQRSFTPLDFYLLWRYVMYA